MSRDVRRYVTELLAEVLGPPEIEKRYDWARGDPGTRSQGMMLPFDAWHHREPTLTKPGARSWIRRHRGEFTIEHVSREASHSS